MRLNRATDKINICLHLKAGEQKTKLLKVDIKETVLSSIKHEFN
jgi:hypothetical protein